MPGEEGACSGWTSCNRVPGASAVSGACALILGFGSSSFLASPLALLRLAAGSMLGWGPSPALQAVLGMCGWRAGMAAASPGSGAACAQFRSAPASTQIPASWVTGVLNLYCHASSLAAAFEVYKNHIPCLLTDWLYSLFLSFSQFNNSKQCLNTVQEIGILSCDVPG